MVSFLDRAIYSKAYHLTVCGPALSHYDFESAEADDSAVCAWHEL